MAEFRAIPAPQAVLWLGSFPEGDSGLPTTRSRLSTRDNATIVAVMRYAPSCPAMGQMKAVAKAMIEHGHADTDPALPTDRAPADTFTDDPDGIFAPDLFGEGS